MKGQKGSTYKLAYIQKALMFQEFNSGWWEEHGNEAIMQVWTERYGAFLDNGDQDQDQTSNVNVGGWGDIGVTQNEGKTHFCLYLQLLCIFLYVL